MKTIQTILILLFVVSCNVKAPEDAALPVPSDSKAEEYMEFKITRLQGGNNFNFNYSSNVDVKCYKDKCDVVGVIIQCFRQNCYEYCIDTEVEYNDINGFYYDLKSVSYDQTIDEKMVAISIKGNKMSFDGDFHDESFHESNVNDERFDEFRFNPAVTKHTTCNRF